LLIVVAYLIIDIVASHEDSLVAFRVIFVIFAFPFLLSTNGLVLFVKWKELGEQKLIRNTKIVSVVFACLLLLIVVIWAAFLRLMFTPTLLPRFDYPTPSHAIVTNSTSPALCRLQVRGWSLPQISALLMLAYNPTEESVQSGIKMVFGEGSNVGYQIFESDFLSAVVFTAPWSQYPVLAFQGLAHKPQLGILLENILTFWFPTAMDLVIPCFELVNDIFLVRLLNLLVSIAMRLFVGVLPMSEGSAKFGTQLGWKIRETSGLRPVVVGHMSGGLVAKGVGLNVDGYTVAFETLRYRDSVMELLTGTTERESRNQYNIYSSPAIFAMPEEEIITNIHLPGAFQIFRPPTPYSTFCLFAAGCVSDDSFEEFCRDKELDLPYDEYFEHWLRERH
jgi:hypothetical protein